MTGTLALQLLIAILMVSFTVLLHLAGLGGLIALMREHGHRLPSMRGRLAQAALVMLVVLGLFALHSTEIWAYAELYWSARAVKTFEDALLFSTGSYVTSGSPEVPVGHAWRLVGAIEGVNGVILFGWSTAFFVSIVARIRELEDDWLVHE